MTSDDIARLFDQHGPMTSRGFTQEFGGGLPSVRRDISRAHAIGRIYIHHWERGNEDGRARTYLRPVYACGNAPDAKRTISPITPAEAAARYKERHRAVVRIKRWMERKGTANMYLQLVTPQR